MTYTCRCESCLKPAKQCGPLKIHTGLGAAVCLVCLPKPNAQRIQEAHVAERSLGHSSYRRQQRQAVA
jgi:hypothetical protein